MSTCTAAGLIARRRDRLHQPCHSRLKKIEDPKCISVRNATAENHPPAPQITIDISHQQVESDRRKVGLQKENRCMSTRTSHSAVALQTAGRCRAALSDRTEVNSLPLSGAPETSCGTTGAFPRLAFLGPHTPANLRLGASAERRLFAIAAHEDGWPSEQTPDGSQATLSSDVLWIWWVRASSCKCSGMVCLDRARRGWDRDRGRGLPSRERGSLPRRSRPCFGTVAAAPSARSELAGATVLASWTAGIALVEGAAGRVWTPECAVPALNRRTPVISGLVACGNRI